MKINIDSLIDKISYYGLSIFTFIGGSFTLYIYYILPLIYGESGLKNSSIVYPLILFLASITIFIYKKSKLNYREFIFSKEISLENIERVFLALKKRYGWNKLKSSMNEYEFRINRNSFFEGVSKVSIIKSDEKIFINSIYDPSVHRSNGFSNDNSRNIEVFIEYMKMELSGADVLDVVEKELKNANEEFLNESEFTIKKNLSRLFVLVFLGIMLFVNCLIVIEEDYFGLLITGIPVVICLKYIYDDIRINLMKRKHKYLE